MRSFAPVSYTHLDVYKRQALFTVMVQTWAALDNRLQRLIHRRIGGVVRVDDAGVGVIGP